MNFKELDVSKRLIVYDIFRKELEEINKNSATIFGTIQILNRLEQIENDIEEVFFNFLFIDENEDLIDRCIERTQIYIYSLEVEYG